MASMFIKVFQFFQFFFLPFQFGFVSFLSVAMHIMKQYIHTWKKEENKRRKKNRYRASIENSRQVPPNVRSFKLFIFLFHILFIFLFFFGRSWVFTCEYIRNFWTFNNYIRIFFSLLNLFCFCVFIIKFPIKIKNKIWRLSDIRG